MFVVFVGLRLGLYYEEDGYFDFDTEFVVAVWYFVIACLILFVVIQTQMHFFYIKLGFNIYVDKMIMVIEEIIRSFGVVFTKEIGCTPNV